VGGPLWPNVSTQNSYARQHTSGNTLTSANDLGKTFDLYQVGFDASWELDVFGGNLQLSDAGIVLPIFHEERLIAWACDRVREARSEGDLQKRERSAAVIAVLMTHDKAVETRNARVSSWHELRASNLILLGSPRTNPFVQSLQGDEVFLTTVDHIDATG
jgi:hypothetical protein